MDCLNNVNNTNTAYRFSINSKIKIQSLFDRHEIKFHSKSNITNTENAEKVEVENIAWINDNANRTMNDIWKVEIWFIVKLYNCINFDEEKKSKTFARAWIIERLEINLTNNRIMPLIRLHRNYNTAIIHVKIYNTETDGHKHNAAQHHCQNGISGSHTSPIDFIVWLRSPSVQTMCSI